MLHDCCSAGSDKVSVLCRDKFAINRYFRMTLSGKHWTMMSEALNNDDLLKLKHLSFCNIHILDENVIQFSKIISQVD